MPGHAAVAARASASRDVVGVRCRAASVPLRPEVEHDAPRHLGRRQLEAALDQHEQPEVRRQLDTADYAYVPRRGGIATVYIFRA